MNQRISNHKRIASVSREVQAVDRQGRPVLLKPGLQVRVSGRVDPTAALVRVGSERLVVPISALKTAAFGDPPAPNTDNAFSGPEEDSLEEDASGAQEARSLEDKARGVAEKDLAEDAQDKDNTSTTTGTPTVASNTGSCEICGEPYQIDSDVPSLQVGEFWDPQKDDSILAHVNCCLSKGLELA